VTTVGRARIAGVLLEPEQEQLLATLVEASRRVADRGERVFSMFLPDGPALIGGTCGEPPPTPRGSSVEPRRPLAVSRIGGPTEEEGA